MSEALTVFLFDVDGVLIEPLAYRVGISATLTELCTLAGISNVSDLLPTGSDISYMEACGLHDTWDITNIAFSLILAAVHRLPSASSIALSSASPRERLLSIGQSTPIVPKPDYRGFAKQLGDAHGSVHLPDVALELLSTQFFNANNGSEIAWKELLGAFLNGTRSPYKSYGTKLFQNIVLGSDQFKKTYALETEIESDSILEREDRVAITRESASILLKLDQRDNFRAGIYTARPSLPPRDKEASVGYSPEAEIAVGMSGLDRLPLVAMGMMDWLAQQHGDRTEELTKPNTTQALAALLAAVKRRSDSATLNLAYQFAREKRTDIELPELSGKDVRMYVFEDTISGVKPAIALGTSLRSNGYRVSVKGLGIATDNHKLSALSEVCFKQFPNVNEAISFAMGEMKLSP
jgi:hypothetical protein